MGTSSQSGSCEMQNAETGGGRRGWERSVVVSMMLV